MTRPPAIAIAAIAILATASFAAAGDDLAVRVAACAREQDDAARLACFDRLQARPAKRAPSAQDEFGVTGSEIAHRREAAMQQQSGASERIDRISAAVTAISKRAHGELVMTLDNGQVWVQKNAQYVPLQVGDRITILAGALHSYRMVVAGRATAVTRIQ